MTNDHKGHFGSLMNELTVTVLQSIC